MSKFSNEEIVNAVENFLSYNGVMTSEDYDNILLDLGSGEK
ncbi:MAG: hypothetical protein WC307_06860 [Candidatus Nanoarchaeia archaeon]|jgi:hypothetical protein